MQNSSKYSRLKMGDHAVYRICVQGYLEDVWSDRLANMTIAASLGDKSIAKTELVGKLRDQSELLGVLNGLYELRYPLLSISIDSRDHGENDN